MSHPLRTVVLGASANPERYSFKAVMMLKEYGHDPIPVHPSGRAVGGMDTVRSLGDVKDKVDTVTLYVGAPTSQELSDQILRVSPRRIIMNPGAENAELRLIAEAQGIEVIEGCTLVMLKTGTF
jgi:predicted CoA-binding protein